MKKKAIFLMLTFIMMSVASVNAQVTIGSVNDPHKGAILDMPQSNSDAGVLFPNVYLFNTREFTLPADDGLSAKGMVIYNSNASLFGGAGLYAWNGSEWKSMSAGSANSCIPVTAMATSEESGSNAKITVNVTAGNPTFSYIWSKDGIPVRTTANVSAASDTYTTAGEGIYIVTITNPCTATPILFTFEVSDSGETLVDNGNGTKTDSQGNLVVETGEGTKIYAPVKSDVPGIYLDEAGEIVYTGADGIPDTDDDDVFVVPDYPLPIQKTLFSRIYPMAVLPDGEYQMKLAFADGHAYPGSYTGKIKFMSNDPDIIAIDENGLMKASSTGGQSTAITIILEDGSILSASTSIHPTKTLLDGYKLAGVLNTDVILTEGMIGKVTALRRAVDGSQNAHNTTDLSYSMADDGDTDSSVTPGGWFHAGSAGKATVTATATDDAGNTFTGTITVTILGEPSEEIDYETASTDWADLEPAPAYAGGDGTEAGPYQVSSVRQLKKLAVDIELLGSTEVTYQKYFELTADLDFSADNTVKSTLIGAFYGTFDGKGHVIKDLHIDATGRSSVSLFAGLTYGEIKNLGREGGSITGNNTAYASGLVLSVNKKGKLKNCYNSSSINILTFAGGLVNSTSGNDIIIENCYNTGEITVATEGAAGLNGTCLWNGGSVTIINSYNTGRIKSQYAAGSLMYELNNANGNEQTVTLNNVFNFGDMNITNLENRIGSLIGYIYSSSSGEVYATNVYSKPDVASVREVIKSNQPIGWGSTTFRDAVLAANPTLGENSKYTTEYSQSPAFATELGDAFKYVPGRTPKLAWEK